MSMGVYIEGIEMPKSCEFCPCRTADAFGGLGCQATGYIPLRKVNQNRPDWCPLVPVPPHGRLGDLDKLEQMFADIDNAPFSGFDGEDPFYSAADAAQIIRLSPTVIPAEEAEEAE